MSHYGHNTKRHNQATWDFTDADVNPCCSATDVNVNVQIKNTSSIIHYFRQENESEIAFLLNKLLQHTTSADCEFDLQK